jgi:transcriptional regulator with XRE-family HTH domain
MRLSEQMQLAQIPSFRELAKRSGLSRYQINKIRRGEWDTLTLAGALRLAQVLQLSLEDLLAWTALEPLPNHHSAVSQTAPETPNDRSTESLDYQHLQHQLHQQTTTLTTQLQRDALHQLESWLRNWPKVVHAIHNDKPDLLAAKILPLLRPLELLLQTWGVEPIGKIGDCLPYSPQEHQPLSPIENSNVLVEIQRPGYRHQGSLLFRAEVRAIESSHS